MVNRIKKIITVLLSCAVVLVPFSNFVPKLTSWIVRDRMRYLYRELRIIETKLQTNLATSQLDAFQSELEDIDRSANNLGVPTRYSDLFFELKIHINHVRQRLELRRATDRATSKLDLKDHQQALDKPRVDPAYGKAGDGPRSPDRG